VFSSIFATARQGMAIQAQRVEAAARTIASQGATPPASDPQPPPASGPVRVGNLPVGDTVEEAIVTLVEAQRAYEANALVIKTATEMFDSLLNAVDHDHDHK
jgi:flagellar basal body rod protein FlgC